MKCTMQRATRELVFGVCIVHLALCMTAPGVSAADKEYTVKGMVLRVDAANRSFVVSHEKIIGLMESMIMPFDVRDATDLSGMAPGAIVEFTLVVGDKAAYATKINVERYQSVEQDPLTARRLQLLRTITGSAPTPLAIGNTVPDFTLTNQARRRVSLSQFRGKVVAVNFIYTSCVLPQFCYRVANHFGVVRDRFGLIRLGFFGYRRLFLLLKFGDERLQIVERLQCYCIIVASQ